MSKYMGSVRDNQSASGYSISGGSIRPDRSMDSSMVFRDQRSSRSINQ